MRLRRPLALTAAALSLGAALAGCQALGGALGGGGGVMPAAEVGPPPSLRSALPGREARMANVDADGRPLATAPTRTLDLPRDKRNEARAANDGPRRIRREEIDGEPTAGGSSSSMAPALTPAAASASAASSRAFSSEVDAGSREENATTQQVRAFSVIQRSRRML